MSLTARAIAVLLALALLVAGWWRLTAHYERVGYDRARAEDTAAMQAQADRNRELQRASEKKYVARTEVRDRFIVTTVREISDAAAPLAACPVPEPVRVRLNAAAACARDDSATADACADAVPAPR